MAIDTATITAIDTAIIKGGEMAIIKVEEMPFEIIDHPLNRCVGQALWPVTIGKDHRLDQRILTGTELVALRVPGYVLETWLLTDRPDLLSHQLIDQRPGPQLRLLGLRPDPQLRLIGPQPMPRGPGLLPGRIMCIRTETETYTGKTTPVIGNRGTKGRGKIQATPLVRLINLIRIETGANSGSSLIKDRLPQQG